MQPGWSVNSDQLTVVSLLTVFASKLNEFLIKMRNNTNMISGIRMILGIKILINNQISVPYTQSENVITITVLKQAKYFLKKD